MKGEKMKKIRPLMEVCDRQITGVFEIPELGEVLEFQQISHPMGGGDPWIEDGLIINNKDVDIEKIRRRVRDALNKTGDYETILRIAVLLSVKLD